MGMEALAAGATVAAAEAGSATTGAVVRAAAAVAD